MQVKKQQLQLDREWQTGSKLGKKYVKAVLFNTDFSFCFFQHSIFMMYSAYKLNKQGNNIQPRYTPFPFETSLLFQVQL